MNLVVWEELRVIIPLSLDLDLYFFDSAGDLNFREFHNF